MDETESTYLKHCRKVVHMGHRRFLAANHPVRKKGKHFEHKADYRMKLKHCSGKTVFAMVKDLKVVFGKGPGSQLIESEDGHAAMFWLRMVVHVCSKCLPFFHTGWFAARNRR